MCVVRIILVVLGIQGRYPKSTVSTLSQLWIMKQYILYTASWTEAYVRISDVTDKSVGSEILCPQWEKVKLMSETAN